MKVEIKIRAGWDKENTWKLKCKSETEVIIEYSNKINTVEKEKEYYTKYSMLSL